MTSFTATGIPARAGKGSPEAIAFTEAEITNLLRQGLSAENSDWPVQDLQVVFLDGAVEVFAITESKRNVPLLVVFEPHITPETISARIKEAEFGDIGIPSFALNLALDRLLEPKLKELHAQVFDPSRKGVRIESLEIKDGELRVNLAN